MKREQSGGWLRPSMTTVYILGIYLIMNFVLRFTVDHWWPETAKHINFVIFVYLIYHFLRKPLLALIDSKIADVDELLTSTKTQVEEARTERQDAQAALDGISAEIEELLTRAKDLGEMEREALAEDGEERARNILEQAEVTIQGRECEIRQEIREEFAGRCVEAARARLAEKLTPEVQIALIRARISAVGRHA